MACSSWFYWKRGERERSDGRGERKEEKKECVFSIAAFFDKDKFEVTELIQHTKRIYYFCKSSPPHVGADIQELVDSYQYLAQEENQCLVAEKQKQCMQCKIDWAEKLGSTSQTNFYQHVKVWWEMIPAPTSATSQTVCRQYAHWTVFVSKQSNGIILLSCNQWEGTNGKTIKINNTK